MSLFTTCLRSLLEAVPTCSPTDRIAAVLARFRTETCDRLVVLDQHQRPLGLIQAHQLLSHLSNFYLSASIGSEATEGVALRDFYQPLHQVAPDLLTPIPRLPADLTVGQFWQLFQEQEQRFFALLENSGEFAGLLDSHTLRQLIQASGHSVPTAEVGLETYPADRPPSAPDQADSTVAMPALVQFLERLPLPLMLQTSAGEVVTQNSVWRHQFGELVDPGCIRRDAAALLGPQLAANQPSPVSYIFPWAEQALPEVEPTMGEAITSAIAADSDGLSSCQPGSDPNTCICACPTKAGQERILQLLKIPLGNVALPPNLNHALWAEPEHLPDSTSPADFCLATLGPCPAEAFPTPTDNTATLPSPTLSWPMQPDGLWLVLAQDITEQQQLARELTAKNADLIHLNRLKDEFLACISHELRTPLTAVLGLSSLLKDQSLGSLNDRQVHYAHLIHQSGRHLMAIVNDILDLTRMETGQLELAPEPVNIPEVCHRAFQQAQQLRLGEEKPSQRGNEEARTIAEFTLEIEPGVDQLIADELRLRQMLVNLLSNALKFTGAEGQVGLRVNRWEGWIAFTVWDTGIGIPANKQHLIFQKFQQLENPLTRRFDGTGLGLVLTQRLARMHGGDISFTSQENRGSQFTLLLPPSPAQLTPTLRTNWRLPDLPTQPPPLNANRLVLLVEATPRFIEHLSDQLTDLGYRVVIARAGTEALEKARRLQPCAIFLNPLLPLLSGWDVLTLLKSDSQTRHIPVIVTATRGDRERAYRHHADSFLSLPIQPKALQQSLAPLVPAPVASPPAESSDLKNLIVLRLSPGGLPGHTPWAIDLNALLHTHRYRVLEADDLEQAELLARVWKPHVVLLDGILAKPAAFLEQLSQQPFLAALPLVTLDAATTQAANRLPELSVFPCLLPLEADDTPDTEPSEVPTLLQVLQVAAGFAWRPLILAMDAARLIDAATLPARPPCPPSANTMPGETGWLGALVQYIQAAGFRGTVGRSSTEAIQKLQASSVDLLLLGWWDSVTSEAMATILTNLHRMMLKPPILILDHRLAVDRPAPTTDPALADILQERAISILPSSLEMEEVLNRINQVLSGRSRED